MQMQITFASVEDSKTEILGVAATRYNIRNIQKISRINSVTS